MQAPPLDRVLILAPHPDDDVIPAGGLIQRVVAAGGHLRVLIVTNGESNAWPQRAMLKKWRITEADRQQWIAIRAGEAVTALGVLGVPPASAFFLHYRDQELSRLARCGDGRLGDDISAHVGEFRPSLVLAPSVRDVHPDHRALSYFAHRAIADPALIMTYLVHGKPSAMRALFSIHLTEEEQQRKRQAIACHQSQLALSRRRFLSYARTTETFFAPELTPVKIDSALAEKITVVRHATRALFGVRQS